VKLGSLLSPLPTRLPAGIYTVSNPGALAHYSAYCTGAWWEKCRQAADCQDCCSQCHDLCLFSRYLSDVVKPIVKIATFMADAPVSILPFLKKASELAVGGSVAPFHFIDSTRLCNNLHDRCTSNCPGADWYDWWRSHAAGDDCYKTYDECLDLMSGYPIENTYCTRNNWLSLPTRSCCQAYVCCAYCAYIGYTAAKLRPCKDAWKCCRGEYPGVGFQQYWCGDPPSFEAAKAKCQFYCTEER